jgi:uncharacterized protein (TIGR03067 family)
VWTSGTIKDSAIHEDQEERIMRLITAVAVAGLVLWCLSGSSLAAGLEGEQSKTDLQKLQGTWVMVSGEWDGKKVADEHVAAGKIMYDGEKMTLSVPHQSSEAIVAEIIKIDTTKDPSKLHFVRKNGPSAGKTIIGIYKFDGADQYHFAFDPTGSTTPQEVTAKEGTGHIKHTWKRVKQ